MGVQPIAVPQGLAYVLNSAGDKSNVDFDYLLQTAMRESSLNPDAKAPSSSAVGLFQFLDTTWLQVMKEEGPRLGYQKYADAITTDKDGDYTIKDKTLRAQMLKLREDPQVAADVQPDPKFAAQQIAADPAVTPAEIPSRFSKADMSFTALFATETPTGTPVPLIGAEAAAPLIDAKGGRPLAMTAQELMSTPEPLAAIDSAMSGPKDDDGDGGSDDDAALGFAPLPSPLPLIPDAASPAATATTLMPMDLLPADPLPPEPLVDNSIPQPRVLMTPREGASSAFLTQLYTQN